MSIKVWDLNFMLLILREPPGQVGKTEEVNLVVLLLILPHSPDYDVGVGTCGCQPSRLASLGRL